VHSPLACASPEGDARSNGRAVLSGRPFRLRAARPAETNVRTAFSPGSGCTARLAGAPWPPRQSTAGHRPRRGQHPVPPSAARTPGPPGPALGVPRPGRGSARPLTAAIGLAGAGLADDPAHETRRQRGIVRVAAIPLTVLRVTGFCLTAEHGSGSPRRAATRRAARRYIVTTIPRNGTGSSRPHTREQEIVAPFAGFHTWRPIPATSGRRHW
jgi:hypothetical protein